MAQTTSAMVRPAKAMTKSRFELAYAALAPDLKVYAPWKDQEFLNKFQGRVDLINFAEEQGITIPVTLKKPYSTDENLMHKSYESGMLEDPNHIADTDFHCLRRSYRSPGPERIHRN